MQQSKNSRALGAILSLTGGAMWGISGTVGQYLFTRKGLSALWLTPIRLFLAGVILLVYHLLKNRKAALAPWREKRDAIDLVIYGLAGVSFCQLLYFSTIQLSSAGVATILQDLSPIMILACGCIAAKRRPNHTEVISIALALAGVLLLVTHGRLDSLAISPAALAVGVLCAGTVTLYNVYPKRLLSRHPVSMLQGWSFLMGGALMLVLFRPWEYSVVIDLEIALGIAAVVIIGNLLAFTCYMNGVRMIGPGKACLYGFAEPVAAAALSSLWLGSPFTWWDAAGFACVFVMLVMLSFGKSE
ncbi:MAG: DMT family transporter [Clostridia bacterium]|nr:DMT family transporter [Clostridia bacterium]